MLKNLTQFKSVINGIENFFHFDSGCPTNIAKESILECLKWIGQVEDQAKARQEAEKNAASPEPIAPPEPPTEAPKEQVHE